MRKALLIAGVFVWVCTGCGGADEPTDASVGRDGGLAANDASVDGAMAVDGSADHASADASPDALPPRAAAKNPIVPGDVKLVGDVGTLSSCSQQAPPAGDRWCAFFRAGSALGTTELWVFNATQAATFAVACDGSDPWCKRMTNRLWTEAPSTGPAHPQSHRFTGDTLIFYAGGSAGANGFYRGKVWAWRPGWAQPRALTDDAGTLCYGHPRAAVAACLGNVTTGLGTALRFDLFAGPLVDADGSTLPKVDAIIPNGPNGETKWRADFSPSGALFAYSTPTVATGAPILHVMRSNETADPSKRTAFVEPAHGALVGGASEFRISADDRSVFYLRDFDAGADLPTGTLVRADVATGARADLAADVLAYEVLVDDALADHGVAIYAGPKSIGATLRWLRDATKPGTDVTIADGVANARFSKDLRFALFAKKVDTLTGLTDAWVTELDGTPTPCALQMQARTAAFGAPFTDDSSLVFWTDAVDTTTFTGEGWLANPADCSGRARFAQGLDWLFTSGKRVVFSHRFDASRMTLSVVTLTAEREWPAAGGVDVRTAIDRTFGLTLPALDVAAFTLSTGRADTDGLHVAKLAP